MRPRCFLRQCLPFDRGVTGYFLGRPRVTRKKRLCDLLLKVWADVWYGAGSNIPFSRIPA